MLEYFCNFRTRGASSQRGLEWPGSGNCLPKILEKHRFLHGRKIELIKLANELGLGHCFCSLTSKMMICIIGLKMRVLSPFYVAILLFSFLVLVMWYAVLLSTKRPMFLMKRSSKIYISWLNYNGYNVGNFMLINLIWKIIFFIFLFSFTKIKWLK